MTLLQSGITKSLAETYTIDQSLRFNDGDSPALTRTPTVTGNQKTFTFSAWVKRCNLGATQTIFEAQYSGGTSGSRYSYLQFGSDDTLLIFSGEYSTSATSQSFNKITLANYRDVGAWYHVVWIHDTTESVATDRDKIYVNGVESAWDTGYAHDLDADEDDIAFFNITTSPNNIGRYLTQDYLDLYLAEVYFIDGTAYDASDFGETNATTNQWKPLDSDDVKDAVTFGTNGFYQKYASTELAADIQDSSGNSDVTIEVNGNTHTDTTIKKIGTASAQFDGTGDYLYLSSAAGASSMGPDQGSFTIECWIYRSGTQTQMVPFGAYNSWVRWETHVDGDWNLMLGWDGTERHVGGTWSIDTWYHIALVGESGGLFRFFVDGVLKHTGTKDTSMNWHNGFSIGDVYNKQGSSSNYAFEGYIDELRISDSVRYVEDFTPDTTEFTPDSNTLLLMHMDGANDGTSFPINANKTITNVDIVNTRAFGNESTARDTYTSAGSTTWIAPIGVTSVDYLVVAGGGGGGGGTDAPYVGAGGGGAGGFKTGSLSVTPGSSYTVTVGAGGTTQSATGGDGIDGSDSVFSSITSTGGGGGGGLGSSGDTGGSGGGGPGNGSGGAGTGSEGFAGGDGVTTDDGAGGGGGASEVGADGAVDVGGDGGDGVSNSLSGSATTYGGGGGGGSRGGTGSSGGSGGGGAGGYGNGGTVHGAAGTANTGGGGGGGGYINGDGGAGGSGIVIISYARIVPGSSSMYFSGETSGFTDGDYLQLAASDQWAFGTGEWTLEGWFYNTSDANNSPLVWSQRNDSGLSPLDNSMQDWGAPVSGDTTVKWQYQQPSVGNVNVIHQSTYPKDSWHHIATVRSGDTVTVYLDGVASTSTFDATGLSMGLDRVAVIGTQDSARAYCFEGYVDEIRISDTARYTGAFTPSTTQFTADSNTLLLIHSDWDGGLGADSSGNFNNFTPVNLVATDQMVESPTNNFCTYNAVQGDTASGGRASYQTLSEGNLKSKSNTAADAGCISATIPFTDGKWYFEFYPEGATGLTEYPWLGITDTASAAIQVGIAGSEGGAYLSNGNRNVAGSATSYGATFTDGDIIGMAVDADNGAVYFSKNNTWQDSGVPTSGASKTGALETWTGGTIEMVVSTATYPEASRSVIVNFGQDSSFAGEVTAQGNADSGGVGDFYYTPPTDFLALCTSNLSAPEIKLPAENFNTIIYDDGAGAKTGVGFSPDLVWLKAIDDTTAHKLTDTVRGVTKGLNAATIYAQSTDATGLTAFGADGFTVGANADYSTTAGDGMVGWNWLAGTAPTADNSAGVGATPTAGSVKIDGSNLGSALGGSIAATRISANTTAGFSIVEFTGTGANATVAHGLSEAPNLIIVKRMDSDDDWGVGADDMNNWQAFMLLNESDAQSGSGAGAYWNDTAPTASVFSVGTAGETNYSGESMVAYCFHSVEGYSKVGTYVGNASDDGTFVYTGMRPCWIMTKSTGDTGKWNILDNKRNTYNVVKSTLRADIGNAANTANDLVDFVSNGFKWRNVSWGETNSAYTYLYIAYAAAPFQYSNAR